jgi:hypothetical protein
MNVRDAKAPYSFKTLCFEASLLAEEFVLRDGNQPPTRYNGILLEMEARMELPYDSTQGYEDEYLELVLKILKRKLDETSNPSIVLCSRMASFEFSVMLYGIFIHRFLNYGAVVVLTLQPGQARVLANGMYYIFALDEEFRRLKAYIEYFESWRVESLARKIGGDKQWARHACP